MYSKTLRKIVHGNENKYGCGIIDQCQYQGTEGISLIKHIDLDINIEDFHRSSKDKNRLFNSSV